MPGFSDLHCLPEFTLTHVHWDSDAVQPSHPLLPPSLALNLSQDQGLQWVSSLHKVAKVLELQLQDQSFQWLFRADFLLGWLVWSPCSSQDSQKSSPVPQLKSISSLALNLLYGPFLISIHDTRKTMAFGYRPLLAKWCLCFFNVCHIDSSKEQVSFNFVATVTIHIDFGAQEMKSHPSPALFLSVPYILRRFAIL